jgi:hypothetical protein
MSDYVRLDEAIDSYAIVASESGNDPAAPYSSESLAEIYQPRVQQLLDLQGQGYKYARWGWDDTLGHNRWRGVTDSEAKQKGNQP